MKETTIQLKTTYGRIIFEYSAENNTIAKTVEAYRMSKLPYVSYYHNESCNGGNSRKLPLHYIIDLCYVDLNHADLSHCDLSHIDFTSANLSYAKLNNSILDHCILNSTDLDHVNLNYASLRYCEIQYSFLTNSTLKNADLNHTNLSFTDLNFSNLAGTNLTYVNLNSAKNLKYASCSFASHGESGRTLLAVKIKDEIKLYCGCVRGNNIKAFKNYIKEGPVEYIPSRMLALETVIKLIKEPMPKKNN